MDNNNNINYFGCDVTPMWNIIQGLVKAGYDHITIQCNGAYAIIMDSMNDDDDAIIINIHHGLVHATIIQCMMKHSNIECIEDGCIQCIMDIAIP